MFSGIRVLTPQLKMVELKENTVMWFLLVGSFSVVVYLINCLPSKVLKGDSSFFKLYQKQLDYRFIGTFGCACFPCLKAYNKHKWSFIALNVCSLVIVANTRAITALGP